MPRKWAEIASYRQNDYKWSCCRRFCMWQWFGGWENLKWLRNWVSDSLFETEFGTHMVQYRPFFSTASRIKRSLENMELLLILFYKICIFSTLSGRIFFCSRNLLGQMFLGLSRNVIRWQFGWDCQAIFYTDIRFNSSRNLLYSHNGNITQRA